MPFIPRDPRQYRPTNPGQEWLNQLRSGGRITASLPLLDATGSFTDRLKAPGWRERQAAGQRARSASGTYAEPQSRIPGAPTPGTIQASARPSATPSAASVISSLRPRGQGFIEEIAQGPPMTDRPPERVYPNPLAPGGYSPMPGAAPSALPDRTDVGDGGGGFFSDVGGYLGGPGMGNALIRAGGGMMEAAGQPGATFGGSLGTGLRGFADERARFQTSEAARRQTAQAGQTSPQELRDRQNTVRAMLAQRQVPRDQWDSYLARVVTPEGYTRVLDELAPPEAADPTTGTSEDRNIQSLAAARALVRTLTEQGVSEDDPRMIDAKANFNAWQLRLGITELPEGDTRPTARLQEWNEYVALREADNPSWEPDPDEYRAFMNQVPTPASPAVAGMDAFIQGVYNGRASTFNDTLPSLQNVDQTLQLVNHKDFNEVAGVWSGNPIANAMLRYEGNPELLAMLGTFERLGSDRALAILRNFTGAKSNFEFQVSEKMAAKDRSMTPEELRAMLELMRRAYIQEAVRWAQDMVNIGQDVQIQGDYAPVQARFMSDAQGILDQYGAEERSWREHTDPAGIGPGG